VRSTINRRRAQLALSGQLSAIGNAAGIVPYLVIYFIAVEVLGTPLAEVDTGWLWTLAGIALGAVVVKAAATGMALYVSHVAAYSMHYDLRLFLADYLRRLPLGFFTRRDTGTIDSLFRQGS
jgi:ABC-type multidrug transport system fused ATPase/permease subunit